MRISDWSSDVCSSDLLCADHPGRHGDVDFYLAATHRGGRGQGSLADVGRRQPSQPAADGRVRYAPPPPLAAPLDGALVGADGAHGASRSEEHTSELQSLMRI